jgi:hypothetical protein
MGMNVVRTVPSSNPIGQCGPGYIFEFSLHKTHGKYLLRLPTLDLLSALLMRIRIANQQQLVQSTAV